MRNLLSQSKDMSHEYCATVVQLGELTPIEGTDFLATVMVEGREIVVRKDRIKEGDVMIYVSNECQLDHLFLHYNNEFQDEELNANYSEVQKHVAQMKTDNVSEDDIKSYIAANRGYFDKKCRVRMKRIKGVMSMGYLIAPAQMSTYNENFLIEHFDWSQHIGEDFDTVDGELFVKAYVPEVKEECRNRVGRHEKEIKKYDRMIPGQFAFHYDTQQLQREIGRLQPETSTAISVKIHGSSFICGNVKVHKPKYEGFYSKLFVYLPKFLQFTTEDYDVIYSSRQVIKNQNMVAIVYQYIYTWYNYIIRTLRSLFKKNKRVLNEDGTPKTFWDKFKDLFKNPIQFKKDGFYGVDIWKTYYDILKDVIPQGMTVYGEIFGYLPGSTKGIQSLGGKVYDYGCKPGENKLMIYRIKRVMENGQVFELNVQDVHDYTERAIIFALKELDNMHGTHYADQIIPIPILYNGTMKDLYPEIDTKTHWHENVLKAMKSDKRFCMEMDEPMCKNKLPREGIVLRINDDPMVEAFKLKCLKFLGKEAEDNDKGKTSDIEMQERYAGGSSEEN